MNFSETISYTEDDLESDSSLMMNQYYDISSAWIEVKPDDYSIPVESQFGNYTKQLRQLDFYLMTTELKIRELYG